MSVILAALIDRWCGEPPPGIHPVVWMGKYLAWAGRRLPLYRPAVALFFGGLYWLLGALIVAAVYGYAGLAFSRLPLWLEVPLVALLLKPLFALRMLLGEVSAVEESLRQSVEAGRARLAMIVSRDTTQLSEEEIRECALESLAENLSDALVAPLFWFVVLGLPGAAVYRFANTADAMWGFRGRWEWAGKVAARVDDLLNLLPARLTGLALLLMHSWRWRLLRRLPKEAAHTPSPNTGWPMAALALSLDVRLSKPDVYTLNAAARMPTAEDLPKALRLVNRTAWFFAVIFAVTLETLYLVSHG
jgi:adenosylcobinamide-phosphate synthase